MDQGHQVERSEEAGVRVTITRTVLVAEAPPLPVPAPEPTLIKATSTPIKPVLQPTVASKVVIAALTQPSTSQEQTTTPKRSIKTVKKPRQGQDQAEAMEVDGDQASARVLKDV